MLMVGDIQEGFLCPICMKDLGEFDQLQQHFVESHSQPDKDESFIPIKGLFDKAKQRWLKFDLNRENSQEILTPYESTSSTFSNESFFEPQEMGVILSHSAYFKKIRDSRIDNFAVETNKLIIRLDKLVNEAPQDASKRKGKLTNPAFAMAYQAEVAQQKAQQSIQSKQTSPNMHLRQAERLIKSSLSKLKFDGSEVSVSSLFSQEGEEHLRICSECKDLLSKRDEQMEQRTQAPLVVQMYDRLRLLMEEAERILPSYCKMAESLNTGESLYELQTAKSLRVKLVKLQEQIDYTSKKVGQYGINSDPENPENQESSRTATTPSPKQLTLQRNVQAFAGAFLRDMVLSMPTLPQDDAYVDLQHKFKTGFENKIQKERTAANSLAISRANVNRDNIVQTSPSRSGVGVPQQKLSWKSEEGGWTPSKAALATTLSSLSFSSTDGEQAMGPLCEQILLIKEFIRQAAVDGRLDEVAILKRNLQELESELQRQRHFERTDSSV